MEKSRQLNNSNTIIVINNNNSSLTVSRGELFHKKSTSKSSKRSSIQEAEIDNPFEVEPSKEDAQNDLDHHVVSNLEDWKRNMLCPLIYVKAAALVDMLCRNDGRKGSKDNKEFVPKFFNEFERKKAYRIAFAAQRHRCLLKEVLKDSGFSKAHPEFLEQFESSVLAIVMDLYDNQFNDRYANSTCEFYQEHYSQHIYEIVQSLHKHRIKIQAAFARQRVEHCAPSLDAILPEEEQKQLKHASKHPAYVRVNTLLTQSREVLEALTEQGFRCVDKKIALTDQKKEAVDKYFWVDEMHEDMLVFPSYLKEDVYGNELSIRHHLIPQNRNQYIIGTLVKYSLNDLSTTHNDAARRLSALLAMNPKMEAMQEIEHILLTHPEAGTLSSQICSFLDKNKKLLICGGYSRSGEQMEDMLKKLGGMNYAFLSENFTDISPNNDILKFCKVVICNPPCSRSGVVNLLDFILHESIDNRLPLSKDDVSNKLPHPTHVQQGVLNHALKMPGVQKIIYSTFSTNRNENEAIVERALKKDNGTFEVHPIPEDIIENGSDVTTKGVCVPPSDEGDGFYMILLKRKKEALGLKIGGAAKKKTTGEKKKGKGKKKKGKETTSNKLSKKYTSKTKKSITTAANSNNSTTVSSGKKGAGPTKKRGKSTADATNKKTKKKTRPNTIPSKTLATLGTSSNVSDGDNDESSPSRHPPRLASLAPRSKSRLKEEGSDS